MNERIKQVRKFLKLNQDEFGKRLGVTATAISKIENSERGLTEQMILSVCRVFNVNEDWLRNGIGEMFVNPKQALIDDLIENYNLNGVMRNIAEAYWKLDKDSRFIVDRFVKDVALAILGKEVILQSDINNAVNKAISDMIRKGQITVTPGNDTSTESDSD